MVGASGSAQEWDGGEAEQRPSEDDGDDTHEGGCANTAKQHTTRMKVWMYAEYEHYMPMVLR